MTIINHGNTVKATEYSFLANVFAARGYLVISPEHDLPTDPPMVTKVGELYVGRLPQIQRGVANIHFALAEMKKIQPNANYNRVTMAALDGRRHHDVFRQAVSRRNQEGGDAG